MNERYLRSIYWQLTGVVMLAIVIALSANSYLSHRTFERALVPEMAKKAATVGASMRALILKAVEHRIDFRELHGVAETFDDAATENPDFSYFAVTDEHGNVLYVRGEPPTGIAAHFTNATTLSALTALTEGNATKEAVRIGNLYLVSLPIVAPGRPLGMLHVGVDVGFVNDIVFDMLLDVLVVLVVALFFTIELLNFIAGARLESGLRSLASILERGRNGNFAARPAGPADHEFGGVQRLLEAIAARVNTAFTALSNDVDAARRDPTHERTSGLRTAQSGLEDLRRRFRFGTAPATETSAGDQLGRIRAPLFAFILAEELTRSFLPSYVTGLLTPIPGLAPEIVVGLPIVVFMLIVALGQPYFGAYSERWGHRRTMLIGAGIAALGFLASALAHSVLDLLVWRSFCAVGYGMVFVAAQGYVLDHTTIATRARGFALFVGAIMVATVCGPSIGGILADNMGERLVFGVSAILALVSIMAIRLLPIEQTIASDARVVNAPRFADVAALMVNRRFMTLTGLGAIPAKILLTGMCFYLIPLYVVAIGSSQSMAGRLLMTYAVVMVLMAPIATSLARSREHREWLVAAGLIISGAGGLLMLASGGIELIFAAVFLVGLGQSLSITSQSALVSEHCEQEIERFGDHTVYGVYRLLERCGNAMGPLIAGGLVVAVGYRYSFIAIGAMVLACGLIFLFSTRARDDVAPLTVGFEP